MIKRFALIFILLGAATAFAEEVIVEGEAVQTQEASHPTATATVIDATDAMNKVMSVGDAVEESAGVTVRRYGGLGDYSVIMVRGTSPNQMGVYIDGIPLSSAATGVVDLSDLPLDSLSRLELYRGASPIELGANMGGALNLVTRGVSGGWDFGISQSYGSFGTWKSDLFGSGAYGNFSGMIFFTHTQSEGDFEYLDDNGTTYNETDDETVERMNNDFNSDQLVFKFSWKFAPKWNLFFLNETFGKDQGMPGIGAFRAEDARLTTFRNTSSLGVGFLSSKWELRARAFGGYAKEDFEDPLGEIGLASQDSRYRTIDYGGNVLARRFIGPHLVLSGFVEARAETFRFEDRLRDYEGPENKRTILTAAAQAEVYLLDERIILAPSARVERYESSFPGETGSARTPGSSDSNPTETVVSPQFGVKVKPVKFLTVRANAGQYYRLPTFYELFGDRGGVVGNPDLDVESGIHADIGGELSLKKIGYLNSFALGYTYYYLFIEDLITLNQNSQRTAKPENVGRAEIGGHEVSLEATAFDHIRLRSVYTYQVAADRGDIDYLRNNSLPGRPRNELHAGLTIFQKRWGEVFYTLDYIDGNFLDRVGLMEAPPRTIHGAGFKVTPWKGWAFTLEGRNLTDERVYDVMGYPLPGISVFGTASYRYEHTPPGHGGEVDIIEEEGENQ